MESKRKKIKLKIKFDGDKVLCAKSPFLCSGCKDKDKCEAINTYYYPFLERDIEECFKNREARR